MSDVSNGGKKPLKAQEVAAAIADKPVTAKDLFEGLGRVFGMTGEELFEVMKKRREEKCRGL